MHVVSFVTVVTDSSPIIPSISIRCVFVFFLICSLTLCSSNSTLCTTICISNKEQHLEILELASEWSQWSSYNHLTKPMTKWMHTINSHTTTVSWRIHICTSLNKTIATVSISEYWVSSVLYRWIGIARTQ